MTRRRPIDSLFGRKAARIGVLVREYVDEHPRFGVRLADTQGSPALEFARALGAAYSWYRADGSDALAADDASSSRGLEARASGVEHRTLSPKDGKSRAALRLRVRSALDSGLPSGGSRAPREQGKG